MLKDAARILGEKLIPQSSRPTTRAEHVLALANCCPWKIGEYTDQITASPDTPVFDNYFNEAVSALHRYMDEDGNVNEYPMLVIDKSDLPKYRLRWDEFTQSFTDTNGDTASTQGCTSKGMYDHLAFVMAKDQEENGRPGIYIFEHNDNFEEEFEGTGKCITHASITGGQPVEMAGTLEIKRGKIVGLSDESGHYRPDMLDIYRGINKIIDTYGKQAFSQDAQIIIQGSMFTLDNFIANMESGNPPRHELLLKSRVDRINKSYDRLLNPDYQFVFLEALNKAMSSDDALAKKASWQWNKC
jgi:hypothetical protein